MPQISTHNIVAEHELMLLRIKDQGQIPIVQLPKASFSLFMPLGKYCTTDDELEELQWRVYELLINVLTRHYDVGD